MSGKTTPDKLKRVSEQEILDSPACCLPTHGTEQECAAVWEYGHNKAGMPKDSEMLVRKWKKAYLGDTYCAGLALF